MKSGLESMLQSIKEKKSMTGISITPFPGTSSSSTAGPGPSGSGSGSIATIVGPGGFSMPVSYASVAANALNNNIAIGSLTGINNNMGASNYASLAAVPPPPSQSMGGINMSGAAATLSGAAAGSLALKSVQSLAYCYAIDCKSAYEELNRIMRVCYSIVHNAKPFWGWDIR